ncbi:MAG: ABC transporter ATP-binding protein [Bacteriovoracaceae bacterium]|nr:ABC transporter ATP-binding protein [Bacteroidota bacterium]
MKKLTFKSENIAKLYNRRIILENISFSLSDGTAFAITGKNGSGKSTLVKILCGVLSPTRGSVEFSVGGAIVPYPDYYPHIGLVSPYLNMYEEFTAEENLSFIAKVRSLEREWQERSNMLLKEFGIYDHRKKEVRYYSSGMKQRLKYCAALLHQPSLLVLDEPSSNLDSYGIDAVRKFMVLQKQNGILMFATNDAEDLQFADRVYSIEIGNH